jgi:hypothetical protein
VAFVTLTDSPADAARGFVDAFTVPWPIGYDTPLRVIRAYRADRSGTGSGVGGPVAPALYLVGPDGRVRWSDAFGRYRHRDPADLARQLEEEIERVLAEPVGCSISAAGIRSGPPASPSSSTRLERVLGPPRRGHVRAQPVALSSPGR